MVDEANSFSHRSCSSWLANRQRNGSVWFQPPDSKIFFAVSITPHGVVSREFLPSCNSSTINNYGFFQNLMTKLQIYKNITFSILNGSDIIWLSNIWPSSQIEKFTGFGCCLAAFLDIFEGGVLAQARDLRTRKQEGGNVLRQGPVSGYEVLF